MQAEETNFSDLIGDAVFQFQQEFKLEDDDIEEEISSIIDSFRYDSGNRFWHIPLHKKERLCAFLYRWGHCSAGLTCCKIRKALKICEDLKLIGGSNIKLQNPADKLQGSVAQLQGPVAHLQGPVAQLHGPADQLQGPSINIISLGSGHGCDIIGACSALYGRVKNHKVKLTLVDEIEGWKDVFKIVENLARKGDYQKVSGFFKNNEVKTQYLHKDLLNETEVDEAYLSSLREADVIMISRLFSILKGYDEMFTIAQSVVTSMKSGALLLYIDSTDFSFGDYLSLIYSDTSDKEYNFRGDYTKMFNSTISYPSKAKIKVYVKKDSQ